MGEQRAQTLTLEAGGAADAAGLSERMVYLSHGETYDFEVPSARWRQQGATP